LLQSAGARSAPAAIDRYSCPLGAQQQTHLSPLLLSIDGTDKRTGSLFNHRVMFAKITMDLVRQCNYLHIYFAADLAIKAVDYD